MRRLPSLLLLAALLVAAASCADSAAPAQPLRDAADLPDAAAPSLDAAEPADAAPDAAADPPDAQPDAAEPPSDAPPDAEAPDAEAPDADAPPDFTREDHCQEVEGFIPVFPELVARWTTQDDAAPWPGEGLVLVGSSSARRWEGFARSFAGYNPIQRGFGGAQLGEIAQAADALVVRHGPRAVLVYAGTNDLSAGVAPEVVVERLRCLRQRIGRGLGWERPVFFIGIVPTPARWAQWGDAEAVNAGVRALTEADPALRYIDLAAPFLATGAPPAAGLFVSDGLHLSPAGYALWEEVVVPAVTGALSPLPARGADGGALEPGERLLVDLGPSNPGDGEETPSPDYQGQAWSNGPVVAGDGEVLPGERVAGLRTTAGRVTSAEVVITGGFGANGWAHGGHRWPDPAALGELAVGSATGDFLYADREDRPGGLMLRGLDPGRRYRLRLFASREASEVRVTRYDVYGAGSWSAALQTSGAGASPGEVRNTREVAALSGLAPDAWGGLVIDVQVEAGSFGYISLLELTAE